MDLPASRKNRKAKKHKGKLRTSNESWDRITAEICIITGWGFSKIAKLTVPQVKQLINAKAREDALIDLRMTSAIGAAVGPMAHKDNAAKSKEWIQDREDVTNG